MNLSAHEQDIARLISCGLTYKQIASELRSTEAAIKESCKRLRRELKAKNRTDVAVWYVHHFPTNGTADPKP